VYFNDSPDYEPNHGGMLVGNGTGNSCTGVAVYNCIFNKILPGVEMNGGSSGCVIAYNYFRDPRYQAVAQSIGLLMNHSAQNMFNLYEGNVVNLMSSDGYFGSSSHDTLLRNWSTGWTETFTNYNSRPLFLAEYSINYNVIGNVFGITNFTPDYLYETNASSDYALSSIYMLGYPGVYGYTTNRPPYAGRPVGHADADGLDGAVTNTMILHGNWESKTKTQTWSTNSDHTIPNSYYLTVKPSWFQSDMTWPPINPANGYTNLNFQYTLPAIAAYTNGGNWGTNVASGGSSSTYYSPSPRMRRGFP
jgi:hypothetical protein